MIQSVCVCGAGTMGRGIAQASIQNGIKTILFDPFENIAARAAADIALNLTQMVAKGKMSNNDRIVKLGLLTCTDNINDCAANIIIEAIVERADLKSALFNSLQDFNGPDTVFATNTSSISVTSLANNTSRRDKVVGMHFFNPAPVMKLVEIVKTIYTDAETEAVAIRLVEQLGKTPVLCEDVPGFIVNRVARPFYLESLRLAEAGVADYITIDNCMESLGFKMGPFKLMDLIGNDINYSVSEGLYTQLQNPPRLKPSQLQKEKVDANNLGKKTGQGYYTYPATENS